jgi:porin
MGDRPRAYREAGVGTKSLDFHHLASARACVALVLGMLANPAQPASAEEAGAPIAIGATNVLDVLANVSGGLKTGTRILDKFELGARFAGDDHGWPDVTAFLNVQWTDATAFSENLVGDMQTVSNIDGPAGARIVNAWVSKSFEGRGGLKGGIIDLNSEFDMQTTGGLFLNASHGIGPDFSQSGLNGPSIFPSTGLGLVGWWLAGEHWQVKSGIFEGEVGDPANPGHPSYALSAHEGALLVAEARDRITPNFVLGVGGWTYTSAFETLDATRKVHGNAGVYAIADGTLYEAPEGDRAGLSGWLRVGIADERINPVGSYIGAGLLYTDIAGRKADQIGIAVGHAHLGAPARRAAAASGTSLGAGETMSPQTLFVTYRHKPKFPRKTQVTYRR